MINFELGQVLQTRGIADAIENNPTFAQEVYKAFNDYTACKWGDTCAEDAELNNQAIKNNDDRIVAKYITSEGDIFIITEWDRSATTILFASEY